MAETPRPGERVELLEIEDAWLVDPGSGREGRGSLRVEDGRIVALEWGEPGAGGRAARTGRQPAGRPCS